MHINTQFKSWQATEWVTFLRSQWCSISVFESGFLSEAPVIQDFKVVFLVHWPGWIGGQETLLCSSYQVINESLRHTEGVSKHSHWLLTTANLLLLQEITSARCRMCGCAPLFMEHNEGDWLDSAVTPNCHPITHPLEPICYIENCSTMHQFLLYPEHTLLNLSCLNVPRYLTPFLRFLWRNK